MVAQAALDLIPKPPGHPIIGNLLDLQGVAPAVEQAAGAICRAKRGCSDDEAKAWLASLRATSRYLVDIWPKS